MLKVTLIILAVPIAIFILGMVSYGAMFFLFVLPQQFVAWIGRKFGIEKANTAASSHHHSEHLTHHSEHLTHHYDGKP